MRGRRRGPAVAALAVVLGTALATPSAATPSAATPPGATASAGTASPDVDRVVRDARLGESSGLAVSLRHPGVLWTHEDSGNPPDLSAIGPDGRTVATVRVRGVPAVDWEAMAGFRDASGRPMLAVADIGDNGAARTSVSIVVLAEPELRSATVSPERVIRLRYPAGGVDAETLLVDPDGRRAFVVTKGFSSTLYQVPPTAWSGGSGGSGASGSGGTATLVRRAGVPLFLVTDGVIGPNGHPVLRSYGELAVLPPIDDTETAGNLEPLATARLPRQEQGESLTMPDARTVLVGSEGRSQPILRVPLPPDALSASGSHGPGSTASLSPVSPQPGTTPGAGPGVAADRVGQVSRAVPLAGGVLGALVVVGLVVTGMVRRRRGQPR